MLNDFETFNGDEVYSISCTGDAVTGDEVCFSRAKFTGSFRNAKFAGYEIVTGKIVKDSYGADKQQHTFTLLLEDGSKTLIKGRNLYANGVYRKPWADEAARQLVQEEKHTRGDVHRRRRAIRKGEYYD